MALLWALLLLCHSNSAEALILQSPQGIQVRAEQLEANKDKRTLAEVRSITSEFWHPVSPSLLNLSLDPREHWFRIRIESQEQHQQRLILLLDQPLQDFIDLWLLNNQQIVKTYQLGDHRAFKNREDSYRGFGIPLELSQSQPVEIYLRLDSLDSLHEAIPFFLLEPDEYHQHIISDSLWYGIYYGAMLLLIGYNLIIGVMTRERDFFLYSVYLTTFLIWNLIFRGYGHQLLPNNSWISNQGLVVFSSLLMLGLYFFTAAFLKFNHLPTKLHRIIQILSLYQLIPAGLAITGIYSSAFLIFFPGAAALMITILGIACYLAIKGDRSARIFVLAWIILLLATVIYFAQVMGLVAANVLTINSINIGSLIEMLVLALALVDKINMLKQDQAKTLEKNLLLQQQNNLELEHLVAEKTAQLSALNQKLERDSVTDALTNLYNRRRLASLFANKLRQTSECGGTLAFVLIDIDHFKQVNDRFGHQDGDSVLTNLAEYMKTFWQDWNADLFRFGGEEFAIIATHEQQEALSLHLQEFHQMIAATELHPNCKITISIGSVLVRNPEAADKIPTAVNLDIAIAQADNLLYEAKNRGRNLCLYKEISLDADESLKKKR